MTDSMQGTLTESIAVPLLDIVGGNQPLRQEILDALARVSIRVDSCMVLIAGSWRRNGAALPGRPSHQLRVGK